MSFHMILDFNVLIVSSQSTGIKIQEYVNSVNQIHITLKFKWDASLVHLWHQSGMGKSVWDALVVQF